MENGLVFVVGILFLVFITGLNADPIDESRKWGNVTYKATNRYASKYLRST